MSHLLPDPYAKSENHFPGILRSKTQFDRCRPTDYRKDYQEECTSEVGDSGHENITESTYYQR